MSGGAGGAWCIVSREFPPKSGGGIGTYAEAFAGLLAEQGTRVVVVTTHAAPRAEETRGNLTIIRLPLEADERWLGPHPSIADEATTHAWRTLGPHSVLSVQVAAMLPELLDRFGVSVIEGCDTGAPLWHLLDDRAQGKWSADVRIITHAHSPSAWIERLNRRLEQSRVMHELQRMEYEQAARSDGVVTPSVGMARWVREHWGLDAAVIRYPLPATIADADTESDTDRGGADSVVYVGRLEYRKGIDTLLRAWPRVSTNATLHLIGRDTTDYRTGVSIGDRLRSTLPNGAGVVAHGPLPPGRVAAMQAHAGVIVVPSPDDNFPFTCIEAMCAGRCIIAARAGGAAKMIEDGVSGVLFPPGDEASLATALGHLLDMTPEQRLAMGRAAQDRIGSMCNPQRVLAERKAHAESLVPTPTEPEPVPAWGEQGASLPAMMGGNQLNAGWAMRVPPKTGARPPSLIRRIARRVRAILN